MRYVLKGLKWTFVSILSLFLIAVLLIVGLSVYAAYFGIEFVDDDVSLYDEYKNTVLYASEFMPAVSDLGEYSDIKFAGKETYFTPFFTSTSMNLFVQYPEEEYLLRKAALYDGLSLITEPISYNNDGILIMYPFFSYKGYQMQAVSVEEANFYACKYVGFVGYNDDERAICYLLYNDDDRDYIVEADEEPVKAMQKMMKKEFHFFSFD